MIISGCIQRAYSESEPLEVYFTETGLADNFLHHFSLREGADALRQIGVGAVVFRNTFTEQGDNDFGVNGKQLFHREAVRCGEFQYDEMSAGRQYAAHFGQSFIQPFEVADAERYGYSIETLIGKRERGAVLPGK